MSSLIGAKALYACSPNRAAVVAFQFYTRRLTNKEAVDLLYRTKFDFASDLVGGQKI
jgi:hypothetical protein